MEKSPFLGLSAEQTSRHFQIVGSGAFAEVLPVEANRDADFQDAVKNAAVIQIDSFNPEESVIPKKSGKRRRRDEFCW